MIWLACNKTNGNGNSATILYCVTSTMHSLIAYIIVSIYASPVNSRLITEKGPMGEDMIINKYSIIKRYVVLYLVTVLLSNFHYHSHITLHKTQHHSLVKKTCTSLRLGIKWRINHVCIAVIVTCMVNSTVMLHYLHLPQKISI